MKKIVPDPPAHSRISLRNEAHPPVFSVHPAADIEDALARLSAALTSAFETNAQLCEMLPQPLEDLAWASSQSLEIGQALTEALRNRGANPAAWSSTPQ